MNISVIIPSYNPTLHITDTLDSLVPQSEQIHQLVIIIDNDKYAEQADALQKKYENKFTQMIVHTQPNAGRAAARNKGASLSTGDLLLFLDDDMIAENRLIEKHAYYHLKNPNTIITGNGYHNPEKAKDAFSKYLVEIERTWYPKQNGVIKVSYNNFNFTACNMSIPKKVFHQLNGFDEQLRDSEDFDLGVRALKQGINILYDRELTAWHDDWPDIRKLIARHEEYKHARKKLLEVHPDYATLFPHLVTASTPMLKKIVLRALGSSIGSFAFVNSFIFRVLPLNLKFTLYRLTIAAHSISSPKD